MKKLILLLALSSTITSVALAADTNTPIAKEDRIVLESDSTYKFSLSKSCLSFFSLFSTEPAKADTVKREERNILLKPLP